MNFIDRIKRKERKENTRKDRKEKFTISFSAFFANAFAKTFAFKKKLLRLKNELGNVLKVNKFLSVLCVKLCG